MPAAAAAELRVGGLARLFGEKLAVSEIDNNLVFVVFSDYRQALLLIEYT
jgi:hypothetical protein